MREIIGSARRPQRYRSFGDLVTLARRWPDRKAPEQDKFRSFVPHVASLWPWHSRDLSSSAVSPAATFAAAHLALAGLLKG